MAKIIHISLLTQLEIDIVFLTLFFVHIRLFLIFRNCRQSIACSKGATAIAGAERASSPAMIFHRFARKKPRFDQRGH
jgi:hypothetical protein